MCIVLVAVDAHTDMSHLPQGPDWLAPPFFSSPASVVPPDVASVSLLHPRHLPPSASGLVADDCQWAQHPLLAHLESEPGRKRSTCSLHYPCRGKIELTPQ